MHLEADVRAKLNEQARQTLLGLGLIDDTRAIRLSVSVVPNFVEIENRELADLLVMPMEEFGKLIEKPGKALGLKASGRFYLGQLVRSKEGEIRCLRTFGGGTVDVIKSALEKLGLSLEMDILYTPKEVELIRAIRLNDPQLSERYCRDLFRPSLETVGELADLGSNIREVYSENVCYVARELLKVCGFAA
ncbi:MAG: hypothetical protein WC761_06195 [Candidatus Paceibacterota bacterium]|jgi:hypothetical protein